MSRGIFLWWKDENCRKWSQVLVLRVLLSYSIRVAQWVRSLDLTTHTSLSPIRYGFSPGIVNYKKGCTRLATTSDKVYQLLAHNRWFSPGIPASSTTKTGRHDIVEILLKVALKPQKSINLIVMFWGGRRQKLSIVWSPTVNVYKRAMIMIVKHFLYTTCKSVQGSYNPVSRVWFYQLQISETNMWLYFGKSGDILYKHIFSSLASCSI